MTTEVDVLEQKAIDAAVAGQWEEAIRLNKKILKQDKKNLSALLRLAFAYLQTDNLAKAKKIYQQILKIQPINPVAIENLERIKILQTKKIKKNKKDKIFYNPDLFLETVGKTKTVKLVNLGQKNVLAQLMIGQEVVMKTKKRKVEIRTKDGEYIGSLPDDLSKRLRLFLKAKSQYSVFIKENNFNNLIVFIREEKKGKKVADFTSFPVNLAKNLNQIGDELLKDEDTEEETTEEESSEFDLEKIAETLENEEKEVLPYNPDEDEEEE